jgi:response regulator RpfG family c-di-GMP phosphodiesterase/DNA-binding SARP family transcriptional activator
MREKILLVDDDPLTLRSLQRLLERHGYQVVSASSARQAVALAAETFVDLVVSDVRMPEMDGIETLAAIRGLQPGVRSIVITAYASEDAPVRAIKGGVDDYLLKPFSNEELLRSVAHSLELCRLERQGREALEQMRARYVRLISELVAAFEAGDPYFRGHARRVADLARDLGQCFDFPPERLDRLEVAALLHDVGLASVAGDILGRAGRLLAEELESLRRRPQAVRELLGRVDDLREVAWILEAVQERWDGTGYPRGLAGPQIPLEARILAAAEAADSLLHERPHRPALSRAEACRELAAGAGTQFDPAVVAHLERLLQDEEPPAPREPPQLRGRCLTLLRLARAYGEEGGDLEAAAEALERASGMAARLGSPEVEARCREAEAWLAWRQGRREEALGSISAALAELDRGCPLGVAAEVRTDLARLALTLGEGALAEESLGRALQEARQVGAPVAESRALLLLAARALSGPDFAVRAREWLAATPPGLRADLERTEPRALAAVLAEAGRLPDLAGPLQGWQPQPSPRPPLEVRSLGRLAVALEGRPLPESAWETRKAALLFAYLVDQGRPVLAERLADILWPEAPEGARQSLQTTVSRVRRAFRGLAAEVIAFERGFYRLVPEFSHDVADLETACRQVRRLLAAGDEAGSALSLERVLRLYQGDYLEGYWEDWVCARRTEISGRFYETLGAFAQACEEKGQPARAAEIHRRVLDLDPCREEAHLGLVRCLAALGRRDEAIRQYHACVRTLKSQLNLGPGPELVALYQRILAG